jgi:hypothetical protein
VFTPCRTVSILFRRHLSRHALHQEARPRTTSSPGLARSRQVRRLLLRVRHPLRRPRLRARCSTPVIRALALRVPARWLTAVNVESKVLNRSILIAGLVSFHGTQELPARHLRPFLRLDPVEQSPPQVSRSSTARVRHAEGHTLAALIAATRP